MLSIKENVYKYLLPNLLEIQRISFCWFLEKGLVQEFEDFSLIRDYLGELELNLSTKFYKIKRPKYTLEEAKRRDATYSVPIYIVLILPIISRFFSEIIISPEDEPIFKIEDITT